MSVAIRRFRTGGYEVDIRYRSPNGQRLRDRCKAPVSSKSAAKRWGEERERHLLLHGRPQPKKEAPTLEEFAPRFLDVAKANRQKPSGVAAKESILRVHLIPRIGKERLDSITTEDVETIKLTLEKRSAKTINNTLTVLNAVLRSAVNLKVIDSIRVRHGC